MNDMSNQKQTAQNDEIFFGIQEVAEQIGVTAATIRNWEKRGLFVAKRGENGYRRFSYNDIQALQFFKHAPKNQANIGFGKIPMESQYSTNSARQPAYSRTLLSKKWKESRIKRKYSLKEVSQAIGISPSYLSRIENMQANISLDILKRLAEFYGENILFYIGTAFEESNLVKNGEGTPLFVDMPGVDLTSIIALNNFSISAVIYSIEPGASQKDTSIHFGQEFVYVLSGSIKFILSQDREYIMKKGDALSFFSTEPHRWQNDTSKPVSILRIYVPVER